MKSSKQTEIGKPNGGFINIRKKEQIEKHIPQSGVKRNVLSIRDILNMSNNK